MSALSTNQAGEAAENVEFPPAASVGYIYVQAYD